MISNPLVSVIVPAYNAEKFLSKCINSILGQTYADMEIVLVDDGSTDRTGELCDLFAEKDNNIKAYHKKNEGESLTREYGVKQTHGELIAWVDADDWIEPDYIEKMTCQMRRDMQIDIALGVFVQDDLDGNELSRAHIYTPYYLTSEEALIELFEVEKWGGGSCVKVMRRNLYDRFHANRELQLGSDLANTIELVKKSRKLFYTGVCLYHYVTNPDSQCNKIDYKTQLDYLNFYRQYCCRDEVKSNKILLSAVRKRAWGAYEYVINKMLNQKYETVRDVLRIYDENLREYMHEALSEFPEDDVIWNEKRKRFGNHNSSIIGYYDAYWQDIHSASEVYIFGAGVFAQKAADLLLLNEIEYKGFLISDGQEKKDEADISVHFISEILGEINSITLLVGLDENNTRMLFPQLTSLGFRRIHIL